jgi:hypothetical protein
MTAVNGAGPDHEAETRRGASRLNRPRSDSDDPVRRRQKTVGGRSIAGRILSLAVKELPPVSPRRPWPQRTAPKRRRSKKDLFARVGPVIGLHHLESKKE